MTSQMKTKKRKVIKTENRQIIANVYRYLKEEYKFTIDHLEPNCDVSHLRNITQRTADATGVSLRTVERILKEEKERPSTSTYYISPMQKRQKRNNMVDVGGFTANDGIKQENTSTNRPFVNKDSDSIFIEIEEPIIKIEEPQSELDDDST